MDGNDAIGQQRGWQYVNGVQMESFPHANRFERYSEAFQHLRLWKERVEQQPAYSYAYTKTPTTLFGNAVDENGENADWRFRVGLAAALMTGLPHPFTSLTDISFDPENPDYDNPVIEAQGDLYLWDEYYGGSLTNYQWLGRPLGPARQELSQLGSSNLLDGAAWQWKTENGYSAVTSSSNETFSATVSAIPSNAPPFGDSVWPGSAVPDDFCFGVRLESSLMLSSNQEYTIEFEARGNDDWIVGANSFEQVPRMLALWTAQPYDYPASFLIDSRWRSVRISFQPLENIFPMFGMSEQIGWTQLRKVRLFEGGCERWVREFEHGLVLLNMTSEPWNVELPVSVRRLSGTQNPELHDGSAVSGSVTVPARDAIFLRRSGGFLFQLK